MNGNPPFPELTVRPLQADDATRMPRLFGRLSADTIYRRFFAPLPSLSAQTLRQLMDVDHDDREALVALDADEIVAVARWARGVHDASVAEVTVVVDDAWQHLGLGRALTRALVARARTARISTLTATIQVDNGRAQHLAASVGTPASVTQSGGQITLAFDLAD